MAGKRRAGNGARLGRRAPPQWGVQQKRKTVSREDRVRTRKQLGSLRSLIMSPQLRSRYQKALRAFFHFESESGQTFTDTEADLDEGVGSYVEMCWQEGEPRYWAEDTVSALIKFVPQLRGTFKLSWQLISAWQRNELPQRCAPISLDLLMAMCGVALRWRRFDLAVVLALGFHCLLRTAECYSIRKTDLEFHPNLASCILTLASSKSGTRYNIVESVVVSDRCIVARLFELVQPLAEGDLIFAGGYRTSGVFLMTSCESCDYPTLCCGSHTAYVEEERQLTFGLMA